MSGRWAVRSPSRRPASPTTAMIRAMTPETNLARGHLVQCVIMQARPFLLVGLTGGIATGKSAVAAMFRMLGAVIIDADVRSEEHTSELQSLTNLVCRLLLEKKKKITIISSIC